MGYRWRLILFIIVIATIIIISNRQTRKKLLIRSIGYKAAMKSKISHSKEIASIRSALKKNTSNVITDSDGDKNQSKLIVAYTTMYGGPVSRFWRHSVHPVDCEYKCEWSFNRLDYNRSDAIFFHLYNNLEWKDFIYDNLPTRYNVDQKWILMMREPQSFFFPNQLKLLNNKFNISVSFQTDSDVCIPYGAYRPWEPSRADREKSEKLLRSRTKMVAWLVSNCITSSRREIYADELKKHVDIDVFGDCGKPFKVEKGKKYKSDGSRDIFSYNYKFYLAFENADCDDYITEKFWTSLLYGMIPIVRGHRAKYTKFAPPNSYIHADSFITAKRLAEYLQQVAGNSTLYKKYHRWREQYRIVYDLMTANRAWICDICQQVYESPRKSIDVYEHFSEDERCFNYLDHLSRNRTGEHMEDLSGR